ncbi:hypothetical protein KIP88_45410 [Bradyrhizobium sp. SRL28]|nr:hypothetical protein [Bradyrhizobium sp. SRL28]
MVFSRNDAPAVTYDVTIRDARPIVGDLSLDREGFTLVQHNLSCANAQDPDAMRDKYLEEMVPLIKDYFNASWVIPKKDAVIIRSRGAPPGMNEERALVTNEVSGIAHVDYSTIAAPMMAARENQLQVIPIRAYSRLMVIQTWHALSEPPQDFPLALCDGSTVLDTDLVHTHHDRHGIRHGMWRVHYSPLHRWYYFENMKPGEFILFKGYDSNENCDPRSAHTAFDNRLAFPNAKPRRSVECRFFVYYD